MADGQRQRATTFPVTDRLSRPLRDLRVSVIDACNYRCGYCMPGGADYRFFRADERLSFAEIERLVRLFVRLGVSAVRITGGEPLLRKDLPELVARLAAIAGLVDLSLTTNGELLAGCAADLKAAGLQRITVSLDSLDPATFQAMSGGRGSLERVLAGLDAALAAGLRPVKINTVVQKGRNEHHWPALVELARARGLALRFIEYMDAGTRNRWRPEQVVPSATLLEEIAARYPLRALPAQTYGETARRYIFEDRPPAEVGFISSVTQPFCGGCTRARLSADGRFYTCLFAHEGADLRGPLRAGQGDAELLRALGSLWQGRRDRYSEERFLAGAHAGESKVEMFRVGG
jgi:cyclic pyranopterin phosphate synthase